MSRWTKLKVNLPDGSISIIYQCSLCGRISYTPDIICAEGCTEEVFLKTLEKEERDFDKLLADMTHQGD